MLFRSFAPSDADVLIVDTDIKDVEKERVEMLNGRDARAKYYPAQVDPEFVDSIFKEHLKNHKNDNPNLYVVYSKSRGCLLDHELGWVEEFDFLRAEKMIFNERQKTAVTSSPLFGDVEWRKFDYLAVAKALSDGITDEEELDHLANGHDAKDCVLCMVRAAIEKADRVARA